MPIANKAINWAWIKAKVIEGLNAKQISVIHEKAFGEPVNPGTIRARVFREGWKKPLIDAPVITTVENGVKVSRVLEPLTPVETKLDSLESKYAKQQELQDATDCAREIANAYAAEVTARHRRVLEALAKEATDLATDVALARLAYGTKPTAANVRDLASGLEKLAHIRLRIVELERKHAGLDREEAQGNTDRVQRIRIVTSNGEVGVEIGGTS